MELIQALIGKLLEWTIGPFVKLDTFNDLIYSNEEDYYGVFNEDQFGVVAQGMAVMQSISVVIILASIIVAGMRISSSGINPSNRNYTFEYFKDFALVALLFFNLSTIFEIIYDINDMFVSAFESSKNIMQGGIVEQTKTFVEQGVVGGLIIGLCMLGLWIWANFYYMMRTLTLMILTIMSPLAVALYLFPQTKGITIGLFKEYTGTVFVQSIHAGTYWVITSINGSAMNLGSILMFIIFIPLTESIRSLIGLGGQMNDRLSKTAAFFGGSAIMGAYASVKGALNGQSVSQSLKSGAKAVGNKSGSSEGDDSPKGILPNAGTDIGSTSRAERMLKAGDIFSKGGKAIFGAAGAIAGSPMGPVGSIVGSTIGANSGGVIGGVAGRAGMAATEGLANRAAFFGKTGWNKAKGIWDSDKEADKKLANSLADDATTNWANENKDSFMKNLKERFPDVNNESLNKMWDNEVASKRAGFLKNAESTVSKLRSSDGKLARSSDLVNSTVSNLTKDWANKNEKAFKENYDASNPLPVNATKEEMLTHNQNKENAWQQALSNKRETISSVANTAAAKLSFDKPDSSSFINKDDFTNEVGRNIGSVLGINDKEQIENTVKAAASNFPLTHSKGSELVSSTVNGLTANWADSNKDSFMKNYDSSNPLPANATADQIARHNQNKENAWNKAVTDKRSSINGMVSSIATKLGNGAPLESSSINKDSFVNEVGSNAGSLIGKSSANSILAVKNATKGVKTTHAPGSELISSTVNNLTKDWANKNKSSFMQNYDSANPISANASNDDLVVHSQNRESAWQQAISNKKRDISKAVNQAASNIGFNPSNSSSYINRDAFINEVGIQVGGLIDSGSRESINAVRGAVDSVKGQSLYSMKSVNTPLLANQLASIKTNDMKNSYISDLVNNQNMTPQQAQTQWNTVAPLKYQENLNAVNKSLPESIPLDHIRLGNSKVGRLVGGAVGGITTGAIEASGVKDISNFISDTKVAQGVKALPVGIRQAWTDRDLSKNQTIASLNAIGTGIKTSWNTGKNHIADNVVEKQAGFKNAAAFATGIVGGVSGYKLGAKYAAGGPQTTKAFGLKGWNPYNNAVNQQTPEVSQIEQIAQTQVGADGQQHIVPGAIRMVTSRGETTLQVRDKAGQLQTVSRLGSGDSSLRKGETLFQDLTLQDGQFNTASNVYQEDSAGGRVVLNRILNVDPNKLVANRNTPANPRVVTEVQSLNQLVDSGQYYLKDAMKEVSDIQMVIERDRSYLTGMKDNKEYRISPYGPGDTRLASGKVITRTCQNRNNKLTFNDNPGYSNSLKPEDLIPYWPENKRNLIRRENERYRNKSFVGSLR